MNANYVGWKKSKYGYGSALSCCDLIAWCMSLFVYRRSFSWCVAIRLYVSHSIKALPSSALLGFAIWLRLADTGADPNTANDVSIIWYALLVSIWWWYRLQFWLDMIDFMYVYMYYAVLYVWDDLFFMVWVCIAAVEHLSPWPDEALYVGSRCSPFIFIDGGWYVLRRRRKRLREKSQEPVLCRIIFAFKPILSNIKKLDSSDTKWKWIDWVVIHPLRFSTEVCIMNLELNDLLCLAWPFYVYVIASVIFLQVYQSTNSSASTYISLI